MRKFVASAAVLLLAVFVTLFAGGPAQATPDQLTISQSPTSVSGGTTATNLVITTSTGGQLSAVSAGSLLIGLQNVTLTSGSSCTGITLNVSSSSCTVSVISGGTFVEFVGIDYTTLPMISITFTAGSISLPNSGTATFDINQKSSQGMPVLAVGSAIYSIGQQNQQQNSVSLSYASANHVIASSLDGLNNGDDFPGYTTTFTGITGGTYDAFNLVVGDINNGSFYTVPGATSNNYSSGSSAWNPSGTNCGVTNIIRGGSTLSSGSGVTCMKMTTVYNNQTQYWIRVELGSASADDISFTVAPGTFVIANKSSSDQFASFLLRNDSNTNTNYSARKFQLLNASNIGGVGSSGASSRIADFTLPTGIGQPVAGQSVGISASNLALNTDYSITLRSTPQILERGTTTATFMNTTVTIPSGLEPGWHSITFAAVRSDGVATEQVAYFKISESGILLQTSVEVPAELALTAAPKGDQWGIGLTLAALGIALVAAVYTYRRRVFEMVYVLTGSGGQYDIELVEQPKKARYLPMRKL